MNLLERVLTLLRANVNTMIEKSDDPEKVLKQLQLDMRNQLVQVKTQVATAIAAGRKLQSRSKEKVAEAEAWYKKAEQAIQQNNDEAARKALTYYNDLIKQAERYQQQQKEQEQLVVTMRTVLSQLETKIAEVDTSIDLLITRKRNALLQQRVFDALNKSGEPKSQERARKAQDAVLDAEARARALAELHSQTLDAQLEQLSSEQIVAQQINDIRRKNERPQDVPLLHEGKTNPSPLIPPLPQKDQPSRNRVERTSGSESNGSPSQPLPKSPPEEAAQNAYLKKLLEEA